MARSRRARKFMAPGFSTSSNTSSTERYLGSRFGSLGEETARAGLAFMRPSRLR